MLKRVLVAVALAAVSWSAVAVNPSLFQDLQWRLLGPYRGGRVLAASGVPGQPQHFYFGSVNGGVWESLDAGRTWQPVFDDEPVGSIGALAVAPSDPRVLYVGTGEADMRSDIAQGQGMFKSTDGGATWKRIGLEDSQQIGRIIVDPRDADVVFAAALGHPYGPNEQRGVFRSRDGGEHWSKVLGPDDATGAIDMVFEPGNPDVIYASLWQTRRPPWNIYPPSNGPGSGVWKSTDGGDNWTQIKGNGFPGSVGRVGLAISNSAPRRVYAIVDGDKGGLYRSDDAGGNWRRVNDDQRIWGRGWYFGHITVDPKNPDIVYALNTIVLRSDDGGEHFAPVRGDSTGDDFHQLWIDPDDPDRRILAADQGAIVTMNGGKTWSSWHNQPTAQLYHITTDDGFPYRVYGTQQDSGAIALPSFTSYNHVISMEQFHEVTAGGEAGMIAPDPDDPDLIYGGEVDVLDLDTEQTRSIDPTLAEPDLYRRTWTLPLAWSTGEHKALYFGNQKLWRTTDGGEHWDAVSPDLSREDPGAPPNLDEVTAAHTLNQGPRRGVVYAIAPSPIDGNTLWVGTDDGLIWRTTDGGGHWKDVTPDAMTPWSKVGIIEASHFDTGTAYAAVDRHRLDDRKPYIYRTHDGGKTWHLVVDGIRDGDFVRAVREDPARKGLLYAATELGMYVSFDDGGDWQPLQLNLPRTSVRDIDVHGNDVVIGTHGRGIWVLDDVAPLRELAANPKPGTRLFAPAPAIRLHQPEFTGTPLPREEPTVDNPPFGAYIDYVLPDATEKPVVLTISDADGNPVRRYSSADNPPEQDPGSAKSAPYWWPEPITLKASPGMHRFVWPLRYAAPEALAEGNPYADGVWAQPGRYQVDLKVDGKHYRQPLEVRADPRVDLPAEAYAEQFALAKKIESARAQLAAASQEADELHGKLKTLADDTEVGQAARDLDAKVVALAGIVEPPNPINAWAQPPTDTRNFRFLTSQLANLAHAVDDADAAPSPDAREGYDKLKAMLEASLSDWQALKATAGPALDKRLKAAEREPASS